MKQITVRLDDERVEALENLMKKNGFKTSQGIFEHLVDTYGELQNLLRSAEHSVNYWQGQHDDLSADYQRLTEKTDEKIQLLRSIIEEGLGKKVI